MTIPSPLVAMRSVDPIQSLEERLQTFVETASRVPSHLSRQWQSAAAFDSERRKPQATVEIVCSRNCEDCVRIWRALLPNEPPKVKPVGALGVRFLGEPLPPILSLHLEEDLSDIEASVVAEARGRFALVVSLTERSEIAPDVRKRLEGVASKVFLAQPSRDDVQKLVEQLHEHNRAIELLSRSGEIEALMPVIHADVQAERGRIAFLMTQLNTSLSEIQSTDGAAGGIRVSAEDVIRKLQEGHTELLNSIRRMNSSFEWGVLFPTDNTQGAWSGVQILEKRLADLSWGDTWVEKVGEPRLRKINNGLEQEITKAAQLTALQHLQTIGNGWNNQLAQRQRDTTDWLQKVHRIQIKLPFWPLDIGRLTEIAKAQFSRFELQTAVSERPTTFLGIARRVTMQFAAFTSMVVSPLLFVISFSVQNPKWQSGARWVSVAFVAWGLLFAVMRLRPEKEYNQKAILDELRESFKSTIRQSLKQATDYIMEEVEGQLKNQREESRRTLEGMLHKMQLAEQAKLVSERQTLQIRKISLESQSKTLLELQSQCNNLLRELPSICVAVRQRFQSTKMAIEVTKK